MPTKGLITVNTQQFECPSIVYTREDTETVFMYKGGYIDVGWFDEAGEFQAHDCINVYETVRDAAFSVETFFHWFERECNAYGTDEEE